MTILSKSASRILITGASGIIGANLLKSLTLDPLFDDQKISVVSKSGIFPDLGVDFRDIEIIQGDLLNQVFTESLPEFDLIFHAAGYGQPAKFIADGIDTMQLNSQVTLNLLRKVVRGGRFINFSTSEVYSGSPDIPYRESSIGTTTPLHPRAAYIEGKRFGEAITYQASSKFGVNGTSIRIALVFGPGTKKGDQRVLNSFIERALVTNSLVMLDMGEALRAYCYIDDAIKMIRRITTHGVDPTYNLGGNEQITIRKLAEEICDITHADFKLPSKIVKMDSAPSVVLLDLSQTLKLFDTVFEFTSLRVGLVSTINWQREKLFSDT